MNIYICVCVCVCVCVYIYIYIYTKYKFITTKLEIIFYDPTYKFSFRASIKTGEDLQAQVSHNKRESQEIIWIHE